MTPMRTDGRAAGVTVAHFVRLGSRKLVWTIPYSSDKTTEKMRRFWSLSLQRQLAIAIGLLLVPLFAAAIWSGMTTFRERANELGDQTRLVAYTTAAYIDHDLAYLDGTGENLLSNPQVRALNASRAEDLFRRVTAGHATIACIDLVRRAGDVIAEASGVRDPNMKDAGRGWADEVFRTGGRYISPMYTSASGVRYIVMGYPVHDDARQVVGALGFFVNLKAIQESLDGLPVPAGSVVTVADRDGRVVARSADADRYVGQVLPADLRFDSRTPDPVERVGL